MLPIIQLISILGIALTIGFAGQVYSWHDNWRSQISDKDILARSQTLLVSQVSPVWGQLADVILDGTPRENPRAEHSLRQSLRMMADQPLVKRAFFTNSPKSIVIFEHGRTERTHNGVPIGIDTSDVINRYIAGVEYTNRLLSGKVPRDFLTLEKPKPEYHIGELAGLAVKVLGSIQIPDEEEFISDLFSDCLLNIHSDRGLHQGEFHYQSNSDYPETAGFRVSSKSGSNDTTVSSITFPRKGKEQTRAIFLLFANSGIWGYELDSDRVVKEGDKLLSKYAKDRFKFAFKSGHILEKYDVSPPNDAHPALENFCLTPIFNRTTPLGRVHGDAREYTCTGKPDQIADLEKYAIASAGIPGGKDEFDRAKFQEMNSHDRELFWLAMGISASLVVFGLLLYGDVRTKRAKVEAEAANDRARHAEIERQRDAATATAKAQRELASNTSHELRTPITSILGAINELKDGGFKPDKFDYYTDRITMCTWHLDGLIASLLDQANNPHGKRDLKMGAHSLPKILHDAVLYCEYTAKRTKNDIILNTDYEITITVDSEQIVRAISNLIINAAKHAHPSNDKRIIVSAKPAVNSTVEITVRDFGPGILDGYRERIFERGFQTHPEKGGSGIGLSLVRECIELHGGKIEASENFDGLGGALFKITGIPCAKMRPENTRAEENT